MRSISSSVSNGQRRVTFLAAALASLCQIAGATTYYVQTSGNDSSAGTSSAPFRTISKAAGVVNPGDTVIVRDGTYGPESAKTGGDGSDTSNDPVVFQRSGTAAAGIVFKSENKWGAVLDCQMICDAYFNLYNASYITLQDFEIKNGFKEAIHSNNAAHHITLRGNHIHHIANRATSTTLGQDGLYTNAACHDFWIEGNIFHDIGRTTSTNLDHALYLKGSTYTIINNVFYNINHGWHIQAADSFSNALIANNTFAFGGSQSGQIMLWNTNNNLTIRNNIFYQPQSFAINRYASTVSNCTIDNNIIYGPSTVISSTSGCTVGTNKMGVNPQFVSTSATAPDFHVMSGGPGIDAGVNIQQVSTDIEACARPQGSSTDIGAYEYAGTTPLAISAVAAGGITTNSATISWTTSKPADSHVEYGPGGYSIATPTVATLVTQHTVTLPSLTAGTVYSYRAVSRDATGNSATSSGYTFTTAPVSVPAATISLSASPTAVSAAQGATATSNISASGTATSVSFSAASLPSGVTAGFSSNTGTLPCSRTVTFTASSTATAGTYNVVIAGTGSGATGTANVALTITAVTTPPPPPPPTGTAGAIAGTVAQWGFDSGSGTTAADASGYANTATLVNATWATGTHGSVVRLNGASSYLSVKESASLESTSGLTVAFWTYAGGGASVDQWIASKLYSWDVKLNTAAHHPQFTAGGKYAMMNYSLPLNAWHHIAFTFASGTVKGYVDGLPVTMAANTFTAGTLPAQTAGMFIGAYSAGSGLYKGDLDDIRIFNRSLLDSEVASLYGAAPPAPAPTVPAAAAQWSFNEGAGATTADASGNGNTGTLVGATWATGVNGSALRLNGSTYATVRQSASLEFTQNLSVSFWAYAGGGASLDQWIVSKASSWDVKLNTSAHRPQFSAGGKYAMMNYSLPLNTWHHVVFTFASGTVKGYVDGQPVTMSANTFTAGTLPSQTGGLTIGALSAGSGMYTGNLDDLRVFNGVLSATDVATLFAAQAQ